MYDTSVDDREPTKMSLAVPASYTNPDSSFIHIPDHSNRRDCLHFVRRALDAANVLFGPVTESHVIEINLIVNGNDRPAGRTTYYDANIVFFV